MSVICRSTVNFCRLTESPEKVIIILRGNATRPLFHGVDWYGPISNWSVLVKMVLRYNIHRLDWVLRIRKNTPKYFLQDIQNGSEYSWATPHPIHRYYIFGKFWPITTDYLSAERYFIWLWFVIRLPLLNIIGMTDFLGRVYFKNSSSLLFIRHAYQI